MGFYNSNTTNNNKNFYCLLACLGLAFCWLLVLLLFCFFFCISTGRGGVVTVTLHSESNRTNERTRLCCHIDISGNCYYYYIVVVQTKKKGSDPPSQIQIFIGLGFFFWLLEISPRRRRFIYMAWHNS